MNTTTFKLSAIAALFVAPMASADETSPNELNTVDVVASSDSTSTEAKKAIPPPQ